MSYLELNAEFLKEFSVLNERIFAIEEAKSFINGSSQQINLENLCKECFNAQRELVVDKLTQILLRIEIQVMGNTNFSERVMVYDGIGTGIDTNPNFPDEKISSVFDIFRKPKVEEQNEINEAIRKELGYYKKRLEPIKNFFGSEGKGVIVLSNDFKIVELQRGFDPKLTPEAVAALVKYLVKLEYIPKYKYQTEIARIVKPLFGTSDKSVKDLLANEYFGNEALDELRVLAEKLLENIKKDR